MKTDDWLILGCSFLLIIIGAIGIHNNRKDAEFKEVCCAMRGQFVEDHRSGARLCIQPGSIIEVQHASR